MTYYKSDRWNTIIVACTMESKNKIGKCLQLQLIIIVIILLLIIISCHFLSVMTSQLVCNIGLEYIYLSISIALNYFANRQYMIVAYFRSTITACIPCSLLWISHSFITIHVPYVFVAHAAAEKLVSLITADR